MALSASATRCSRPTLEPPATAAGQPGRSGLDHGGRTRGRPGRPRSELESRRPTRSTTASDAQLILHAYHAWGDDCVEHLLGDFAFAIWDAAVTPAVLRPRSLRRQAVLLRRDPGRHRLQQHARLRSPASRGGRRVERARRRRLPAVRAESGSGDDDVCRHPAAAGGTHADLGRGTARIAALLDRCRPTAAFDTAGRSEYVEHFKDLLRGAVADRLPRDDVGVWMSGGLDSTSITATARQICSPNAALPSKCARHTVVYDTLIPDEERHYARHRGGGARRADRAFSSADRYEPFEGWDRPDLCDSPSPPAIPFSCMRTQQLGQAHRTVASCCAEKAVTRSCGVPHGRSLLAGCRPLELAADIARSLVLHRRRPPVGVSRPG